MFVNDDHGVRVAFAPFHGIAVSRDYALYGHSSFVHTGGLTGMDDMRPIPRLIKAHMILFDKRLSSGPIDKGLGGLFTVAATHAGVPAQGLPRGCNPLEGKRQRKCNNSRS